MTNKWFARTITATLLVGFLPAPMARAQDLAESSVKPLLTSTVAPAVARALARDTTASSLTRRFESQAADPANRGTRSTHRVRRSRRRLSLRAGG